MARRERIAAKQIDTDAVRTAAQQLAAAVAAALAMDSDDQQQRALDSCQHNHSCGAHADRADTGPVGATVALHALAEALQNAAHAIGMDGEAVTTNLEDEENRGICSSGAPSAAPAATRRGRKQRRSKDQQPEPKTLKAKSKSRPRTSAAVDSTGKRHAPGTPSPSRRTRPAPSTTVKTMSIAARKPQHGHVKPKRKQPRRGADEEVPAAYSLCNTHRPPVDGGQTAASLTGDLTPWGSGSHVSENEQDADHEHDSFVPMHVPRTPRAGNGRSVDTIEDADGTATAARCTRTAALEGRKLFISRGGELEPTITPSRTAAAGGVGTPPPNTNNCDGHRAKDRTATMICMSPAQRRQRRIALEGFAEGKAGPFSEALARWTT